MPTRHYDESIEVFLKDLASRYACHTRKQERLNMKTHPSPVATALEPEEKSTDRTVRYQLPDQPKVSLGLILGLMGLIAVVVVVYGLFGR
jgi:hypothetical protein